MTTVPDLGNVFHSIQLPDGQVIKGNKSIPLLERESAKIFKYGVKDRTVLDIGAWDGAFSFEAERREAKLVHATDYHCWGGPGVGTKKAFDYAHAALDSKVITTEIDVFDLKPDEMGTFDVVLFLGVLYHLRNPLDGLQIVYDMTKEYAVIETQCALVDDPRPLLRFYLGGELNNDKTNFFVPNLKALENMLLEVGFSRVEAVLAGAVSPEKNARAIAYAFK